MLELSRAGQAVRLAAEVRRGLKRLSAIASAFDTAFASLLK